jgi:hypothetical protein
MLAAVVSYLFSSVIWFKLLEPISKMMACQNTLVMPADFLPAEVPSARRQVSGHPEFWTPD